MFHIVLINMPFADPWAPSLPLTQLESVLAAELGDRVSCRTVYLNQDFARRIGLETYEQIGRGIDNLGTGLGDIVVMRQLRHAANAVAAHLGL